MSIFKFSFFLKYKNNEPKNTTIKATIPANNNFLSAKTSNNEGD